MQGSRRDLPPTAEVVIVGGGIIGLSIAFHLAQRRIGHIVVLERDRVASGATSKATGGIRQQFSTETNVRLSVESRAFFEQFQDRVGLPFQFRRNGYLFLLSDPDRLPTFQASVALQRRMGVDVEFLSSAELARRFPPVDTSELIGATFCPSDGSGSPADAAYAFRTRAKELGAQVMEQTEVVGVASRAGAPLRVQTTRGAIETRCLINAAGPWAPLLSRLAGVELPITAHPRQVFTVTPIEELGSDFPFTVDMASGVYLHQETGYILLGGGDRDRPPSYEAVVDWNGFEHVVQAITSRVPALEDGRSISAWCGLREMTPDDHPILGPVPQVDGLWCAAGFSGHGFMQAPAVGRVMAEWVVDGQPSGIDVTDVNLDRFRSGSVNREVLAF